ncbi:MAG: 3-oxoacyl-ACP reductase family protein [Verrucomicrobiota bacterium]|jgi:NAD(P)-dependent dehydrogenase (short-subunit alcohol dehydrogenase family)
MRLKEKTVLITGASKGIGRALALGMAREGADLILNYNSDRQGAEAVAGQIRELGRRALVVKANIGKVSQIRQMFDKARKSFPRLDVLVNNAGITGWSDLFATTEAKWNVVMDTNLKGTFFCSLAAARWMKETGGGSIVNISTNCAALGVKNLVAYATSKAGIHGLTKQLAVELASLKIRVNTFAPGPTQVERNLRDDPDYDRSWGSMVPMNRTARPDEMIGPAVFLASEESSYMTGQVFFVDGGWTVQGKIPVRNMEQAMQRNK